MIAEPFIIIATLAVAFALSRMRMLPANFKDIVKEREQ